MFRRLPWIALLVLAMAAPSLLAQRKPAPEKAAPAPKIDPRLEAMKKQAVADVESMRDFSQQMVDQVFSFGELGFQEFETQKYLTGILEKEGFTVTRGAAGIPSAWTARWGAGKPVIALGSDVDCIPQASQKPGVAYRDQSSKARRATVKATTRACRSTSPRRSR